MNWVPTLAVDHGVPLERALRIMVMFNLGAVLGAPVLAWLSARDDPRRMLAAFYAGGAAAFMAVGVTGTWPAALLLAGFAAGVFVGGTQVGLFPLATRVYPTAVRVTGVGFAQAGARGLDPRVARRCREVALSPPVRGVFPGLWRAPADRGRGRGGHARGGLAAVRAPIVAFSRCSLQPLDTSVNKCLIEIDKGFRAGSKGLPTCGGATSSFHTAGRTVAGPHC